MTLAVEAVLTEVDNIEAAILRGELEHADEAVKALRPLLVGHCAEDLLALRTRMQELTLQVIQFRDRDGQNLKAINKGRGAAQTYRQMQYRA